MNEQTYVKKASQIVSEINGKLQELKDLSAAAGGKAFNFTLDLNEEGFTPAYAESKEELNNFTVCKQEREIIVEQENGDSEYEYQEYIGIKQWIPSSMSC